MLKRGDIIAYVVEQYYEGDLKRAASASGYSESQIRAWITNNPVPQHNNVGWFLHQTFAPEFRALFEYAPIATSGTEQTTRKQLSALFMGHKKSSGLYAFYDSMANLIYIGKSDGNIFEECCTQLKAKVKQGIFPKGAVHPNTRLDIVRYISSYVVQASYFTDYAKHFESVILRISKPALNTNIGHIDAAAARKG